ncbi:MAG: histone deacetylase [Candidatus Omnitrophota bacterium]|nr:histone deacetylase [Candidatus Omnitrophota bacterium]
MQDTIRLVYSEDYAVDIGTHVFPTLKYNLIREELLSESEFKARLEFVQPQPAGYEDILLVHDKAYLDKLNNGTLTDEEIFALELPYSKKLVRASLLCCGGTMLAVEIALSKKFGVHIGGGFHHAFPDHGEGFCVLNDIAVAIRKAIKSKKIRRALVVDCDLHHGNGTAAIFKGDPSVFTFSIHQENNYPFFKPESNLDIGLRDRATDREYLAALQENIPKIISDFKPELLMYAAGADPYKDDQIGGLSLTKGGLKKRDEFVFNQAKNFAVPIALVLAGGYAYNREDTVEIHYNTIEAGLRLFYA